MGINVFRLSQRRRSHRLLSASMLALALAGCQSTKGEAPAYTGSISSSAVLTGSDLTPEQALLAVQKWGAEYGRNQKNKLAALNYAAALRAAGETAQGVAVMRKAAIYHPTDREVLAGFGKALAADGKFPEALAAIRRAQRTDNPDWQLLAAEGGILDSLGQHPEARNLYRQALVLAPGEPQILNNLGLSYVLTNELDEAEAVLQQAAQSPKATFKTRQNLALVLSLKGKGSSGPKLSAKGGSDASAPVSASQPTEEVNTWEELADNG